MEQRLRELEEENDNFAESLQTERGERERAEQSLHSL
jgi:hypothetical protein